MIFTKLKEVIYAVLPIIIIVLLLNFTLTPLDNILLIRFIIGAVLIILGLTIFLLGVDTGITPIGHIIGTSLAKTNKLWIVIISSLLLGFIISIAEPDLHILAGQVQFATLGAVNKISIIIVVSIGIAVMLALGLIRIVGLSMLRIVVPSIKLWHFLLPGYVISIALTYIVPKIFVGIAFDSGGVASGPMTATFILAFAQGGASGAEGANMLVDGFGMIAMVAMMPLIAMQILGLVYKIKSRKRGI